MASATRARLAWAGRWLLGLALLAFLLFKVRWSELAVVFTDISIFWLVILVALGFGLIWVSCVKWKMFLGEKGRGVPVTRLMSLYMMGYFFSHFLPSQYGGDLVRSWELGREIDSHVTSFGSVFMERYTGFVALMLVSTAAAMAMPDLVARANVGLPFMAAWAVFIASLWFLADERPVRWLASRFESGRLGKAARAGEALHREVRSAGRKPALLARVMALSVLFHFLAVVNTYTCVLTIRSDVDFLSLMVVVPIILMVATIPLTVNSIGLWEGAFVYFLAPLGLSGAQALSVALLLRGKNILMAVLGGLVYLSRSRARA